MRTFTRFTETCYYRVQSVSENSWDAIVFIPNDTIILVGFGLYELHPKGGSFSFQYKFVVEDDNENEVYKSDIYKDFID